MVLPLKYRGDRHHYRLIMFFPTGDNYILLTLILLSLQAVTLGCSSPHVHLQLMLKYQPRKPSRPMPSPFACG